MRQHEKYDILICGAGIMGLTIARELLQRGCDSIAIIDKEKTLGVHASGRNSGVLHAGIYYDPESMRAASCLKGNRLMKEYCREKGLPLKENGKVIVAKNRDEVETLYTLRDRAIANGAKVDIIDEKELSEIEPAAKTCEKALFSHYTAVVDPKKVLASLKEDLEKTGKVTFLLETEFLNVKYHSCIITNRGNISFNTFINAAGAYSDVVARKFGLARHYILIPFKGIYKKIVAEKSDMVRGNIYPVPDIRNPFLGVHFTRGINGDLYLGPTAIPAFSRENYGILQGLEWEACKILFMDALLFFRNSKFRNVALEEPKKYISRFFFNDARMLVKELDRNDIVASPKVGIRPQLIDIKKKEMVMDFIIEKDGNSVHVLNAISPAFTSSMAFARKIVGEYVVSG